MRFYILYLILFTGFAHSFVPEIEWHRQYNGSGEESHPHYVIETSDKSFVMIGETGFIDDKSAKIFVVKVSSRGRFLWRREFGRLGYNLGNSVLETKDGNYVLAGCLGYDAALLKIDAQTGSLIWKKTLNLGTEDAFESVIETANGSLIATGYRDGLAENTFINWGKGVLIKTTSEGDELWEKNISKFISSGYRLKLYKNHVYVAGHPFEEGAPNEHLLKLDLDGNLVWAKSFNSIYWGFDIDNHGNMLLTGHTRPTPMSENWDIEAILLSPDGEVLWTKYFGQPRGYDGRWIHDEVWGVRATPDGGWLLVAGTGDETNRYEENFHASGPSGEWKVYLIKLNADGDTDWEGVYGKKGTDWAGEDVCITSDGGALVANDTGRFGFTKIKPFIQQTK